MPRPPRIHLDAVPLHIVQRGHNRQPCFFAEEDYHTYLHWLNEALHKEHCALHAYALMTNHVHLLPTPQDPMTARLRVAFLCNQLLEKRGGDDLVDRKGLRYGTTCGSHHCFGE